MGGTGQRRWGATAAATCHASAKRRKPRPRKKTGSWLRSRTHPYSAIAAAARGTDQGEDAGHQERETARRDR